MSRKRRTSPVWALALGCLMLAAAVGCANGSLSGAGLAEANREYEAGQYEQAASLYQALVRDGADDARLHYNLGNAHYKVGDLGRAIASYRRAQRLMPRDADIAANLELARAQTVDRLETTSSAGASALLQRALVGTVSPSESALMALALWILVSVLTAAALVRRRSSWLRGAALTTATFALVAALSLGLRVRREIVRPPAVVVAEAVQAQSGPGADYVDAFMLHSGTEVEILEERAGWVRIALPGELQGWIPASALERI